MSLTALLLLAFALSTDAFAAAIVKGASLQKPRLRDALRIGIIFGTVEAITPLIGWGIGAVAATWVAQWGHILAFVLLVGLGGYMVREGMSDKPEEEAPKRSHSAVILALTAIATSIDALVVGFGLALVNVSIWQAALAIFMMTSTVVTIGVLVGKVAGELVGRRAEALGGLVLIGVGIAILALH